MKKQAMIITSLLLLFVNLIVNNIWSLRAGEETIKIKNEVDKINEFIYTSDIINVPLQSPEPFIGIGIKWEGNSEIFFKVNYSLDGKEWSDWRKLEESEGNFPVGTYITDYIVVPKETKYIKYRVEGNNIDMKWNEVIFFSPGNSPEYVKENERKALEKMKMSFDKSNTRSASSLTVISRTDWGCTDGQTAPNAPITYTPVRFVVVHHTGKQFSDYHYYTGNIDTYDWSAAVRSDWLYHKEQQGWGDIGYNYIISPTGLIYEGRAGGEILDGRVIQGFHFSGYNANTLGISVIGEYGSSSPDLRAMNALNDLIAWKCSKFGINPLGTNVKTKADEGQSNSLFTVKDSHGYVVNTVESITLNNISGHRNIWKNSALENYVDETTYKPITDIQ